MLPLLLLLLLLLLRLRLCLRLRTLLILPFLLLLLLLLPLLLLVPLALLLLILLCSSHSCCFNCPKGFSVVLLESPCSYDMWLLCFVRFVFYACYFVTLVENQEARVSAGDCVRFVLVHY